MSRAAQEGGQLANEAQSMSEKFQQGVVTGTAATDGTQGGAQAVQFQRKFGGADPMDDEMNQRMQLMDADGMTPFGQVYYDDKVGRWLQRKAQVEEVANLDSWFNANFNKNNLADRQFAQQIYPEFYDSREQEMIKRAKEAVKLKMIQLRGPQSKEDMYKLWLINTGRVQLPEDWDRIGPSATAANGQPDAATQQQRLKAGLIHMPKFRSLSQRQEYANDAQRYGLWGDATKSNNTFGAPDGGVRNNPLSKRPDDETIGMRQYGFLGSIQ